MNRLKLPSRSAWIAIAIVTLALSARLIPGERTIDDSYITYRYARNILAGNGFVYNPGEAVLGTTTPLYTLLMAGLGALTGGVNAPFPTLALSVNAAADALTCLILWRLGKRFNAELAGVLGALLWALAPFSVTFAIGGLETSVYVLLLMGAMYFYLRGEYPAAFLLAALALLTRPDALIFILPMGLDRLIRWARDKNTPRLSEVLALLLPVAGWAVFATLTFGSPLPHSMTAKLAAYHLAADSAFIRLIQHYATPFLDGNIWTDAVAIAIGIILYPFLFIIGLLRAGRKDWHSLFFLLYPIFYFASFAIPNPLIFRWYLTPPLPIYFLVILLGIDQILSPLVKRFAVLKRRPWLPLLAAMILPFTSTLLEWDLHPDHGPDRPAPAMAFIKLELMYREVAEQIAPELNSQSVLAAGDVGVLGYFTPARILDTVGLNSPISTRYYPLPDEAYVINYAVPSRLILDEKPDFLVIVESYGRNTLLTDAEFAAAYRQVYRVETDIYDSRGVLVFKKE